jgi:hypothetical protein
MNINIGTNIGIWNTNADNNTHIGVRPPNPSIIAYGNNTNNYSLVQIKSREPYAAEYLYTKYGGLGSRVGTNMGMTK